MEKALALGLSSWSSGLLEYNHVLSLQLTNMLVSMMLKYLLKKRILRVGEKLPHLLAMHAKIIVMEQVSSSLESAPFPFFHFLFWLLGLIWQCSRLLLALCSEITPGRLGAS